MAKITVTTKNALEVRELLDEGMFYKMTFHYGNNGGCTCKIGNRKVGACTGGGYSLDGTAFGEFLNAAYAEEITALAEQAVLNENGYSNGCEYGCDGLITVTAPAPVGKDYRRSYADGANGFGSMKNIADKLGLVVTFIPATYPEEYIIHNKGVTI